MDIDEKNRKLDEIGKIAESIGSELHGWGILRQKHKDSWSMPGCRLYEYACQARQICFKLLTLYSSRVLAELNENSRRVKNLNFAIAYFEAKKKALQENCKRLYFDYKSFSDITLPFPVQNQTERHVQDACNSRVDHIQVSIDIRIEPSAKDRKETAQ